MCYCSPAVTDDDSEPEESEVFDEPHRLLDPDFYPNFATTNPRQYARLLHQRKRQRQDAETEAPSPTPSPEPERAAPKRVVVATRLEDITNRDPPRSPAESPGFWAVSFEESAPLGR